MNIYQDIYEYIKNSKTERQIHLSLFEECIEIGGNSREARLLLAHFLKTTVPKGMKIHLCHACNNSKCSNPRHLYWGTAGENMLDANMHQLGGQANAKKAKRKQNGKFTIFYG